MKSRVVLGRSFGLVVSMGWTACVSDPPGYLHCKPLFAKFNGSVSTGVLVGVCR